MAPRPRVLWVSPSVPDHEGGGDQLRQAFLLDRVAEQADVHLVAPGPVRDPVVAEVIADADEVAAPAPRPERRVDRARHLLARDPWLVRRAAPLRAALAPAVARRAPDADVVLVEHLELARLREVAPAGRWVLTVHLAHSRHLRHLATTVTGRQAWFWRRDAQRAARFEAWAARAYDRVVAVSDDDAAALPGAVVVPNGVDLSRAVAPRPDAPRVVLTGSLDFWPNVEGLGWFLADVWPRVRAEVPEATLEVVGRHPGDDTVARVAAADGAHLAADVPAIAPHLDAARVAVVPIRVGAGTRLKALQALAAGRPVVGTTVGLEGLGIVDADTALVRDDADAFAGAVVAALTDDALADGLARRGRAHVEARFGWDRAASPLVALLGGLAGAGQGA